MAEATSSAVGPERRFWIRVERPWKLWILPVLALLYFVFVVLLVAVPIRSTVPLDAWVLGGVGLFGFVAFVQLLLIPTKKVKRPKVKKQKVRAQAAAQEAVPVEELDAALPEESVPEEIALPAAAPREAPTDAEYRATTEEHKGRRVLEISLPPKSQHPGAVYAKAYVPIDGALTLRVEDLVAEKSETL